MTLKIANYALLDEGYTDFWEGVKTGFEAKYPNITIEWVTAPYGEIVNQVINMAGGGDKVDMIFGEIGWIPTLEDAGLTVPVTDVLTADYLADFYDSVLDGCKIGGEIYGLPMYTSPYVLYYNKDLFTQAGLDPNAPHHLRRDAGDGRQAGGAEDRRRQQGCTPLARPPLPQWRCPVRPSTRWFTTSAALCWRRTAP